MPLQFVNQTGFNNFGDEIAAQMKIPFLITTLITQSSDSVLQSGSNTPDSRRVL